MKFSKSKWRSIKGNTGVPEIKSQGPFITLYGRPWPAARPFRAARPSQAAAVLGHQVAWHHQVDKELSTTQTWLLVRASGAGGSGTGVGWAPGGLIVAPFSFTVFVATEHLARVWGLGALKTTPGGGGWLGLWLEPLVCTAEPPIANNCTYVDTKLDECATVA